MFTHTGKYTCKYTWHARTFKHVHAHDGHMHTPTQHIHCMYVHTSTRTFKHIHITYTYTHTHKAHAYICIRTCMDTCMHTCTEWGKPRPGVHAESQPNHDWLCEWWGEDGVSGSNNLKENLPESRSCTWIMCRIAVNLVSFPGHPPHPLKWHWNGTTIVHAQSKCFYNLVPRPLACVYRTRGLGMRLVFLYQQNCSPWLFPIKWS